MNQLSPARIFRYGGVAFLLGVASAHFWPFNVSFLWLGLLGTFLVLSLLLKNKKVIIFCFLGFSFLLGVYRWQNVFSFWEKQNSLLPKGHIALQAVIKKEPIQKENHQEVIIPPLLIYLEKYPLYHYGDVIQVEGKVEHFSSWWLEGSSFVSAEMRYPRVKLLRPASFSFPRLAFLFRDKIENSLKRIIPEPENSLLLGLMFGEKNIPSLLKKQIRQAGLAHIVVVSGLHLSVIIKILTIVFIFLGLGRKENFFFSSLFLLLFSFMAGLTPSIIRASIMAFLLIIAQLNSRLSNSLHVLLLTALIMVFLNPFILNKSLSFQLSFLATGGILLFSPLWEEHFSGQKNSSNLNQWIKITLLPSLSAFLLVAPWVIYKMQVVSVVTPLTNLLVVPLLPFIIILGWGAAFLSWLFYPLGLFLGFILEIILKYILLVIHIFSSFSFSQLYIPSSLRWLIFPYYFLLFIYVYSQQRKRRETVLLRFP